MKPGERVFAPANVVRVAPAASAAAATALQLRMDPVAVAAKEASHFGAVQPPPSSFLSLGGAASAAAGAGAAAATASALSPPSPLMPSNPSLIAQKRADGCWIVRDQQVWYVTADATVLQDPDGRLCITGVMEQPPSTAIDGIVAKAKAAGGPARQMYRVDANGALSMFGHVEAAASSAAANALRSARQSSAAFSHLNHTRRVGSLELLRAGQSTSASRPYGAAAFPSLSSNPCVFFSTPNSDRWMTTFLAYLFDVLLIICCCFAATASVLSVDCSVAGSRRGLPTP